MSLDKSTQWMTHGKTFETWICPLSYLLCGYCSDVIIRLCQDIVFLKAEVAELLFPSIFVNLAGRRDIDIDLQSLISLQAVTHINKPDSLYGNIQSHKLTSQAITFEHEGNWGKALEYYDLQGSSGVHLLVETRSAIEEACLGLARRNWYWDFSAY